MYSANGNYSENKNSDLIESFSLEREIVGVGPVPQEEVIPIENANNCKENKVESLKIGASIHKHIRTYIRPHLQPGLKLSTLANLIEDKCMELTKEQGILKGIGFPSSLSVDDCAAHFTPSKLYDVKLNKDSILKVDFGVQVNGWIIDSAFTIAFNDKYNELLKGVKEATSTGIKNAGIDVNIKEWGKDIQEVMESYEVEVDGNKYPVQVIQNLGGHNILKNKIHGGTFLPGAYIPYYPDNLRFQEGVYAVETFGSTKSNWVEEKKNENTIYMNKAFSTTKIAKDKNLANFYNKLLKKYTTMPYCNRYLDLNYEPKYYIPKMDKLVEKKVVSAYPPLHCKNGGMTAQYEHTIYIGDNFGSPQKIVFSQSTDY